jgi:hypothetical protein
MSAESCAYRKEIGKKSRFDYKNEMVQIRIIKYQIQHATCNQHIKTYVVTRKIHLELISNSNLNHEI